MSEEMNTVTTDGIEQQTEQVETEVNSETGDTAQVQETTEERQERLFRQSELDSIIQRRLEKEKQRFESELKSHPTLSYLEQKAQRLGMTVEQLIENDQKYEEQQKLDELVRQNIPEEYAKKLLKVDELEKWKSETEQQKQQREAQEKAKEKQQKEIEEFDDWYSKKYGKIADFNKDIPKEVFIEMQKGIPLLYAYKSYLLETNLQAQQTQEANSKNAVSSTGSVKADGKVGGFISKDEFEANRHNEKWVRQNLDLLDESRKHW